MSTTMSETQATHHGATKSKQRPAHAAYSNNHSNERQRRVEDDKSISSVRKTKKPTQKRRVSPDGSQRSSIVQSSKHRQKNIEQHPTTTISNQESETQRHHPVERSNTRTRSASTTRKTIRGSIHQDDCSYISRGSEDLRVRPLERRPSTRLRSASTNRSSDASRQQDQNMKGLAQEHEHIRTNQESLSNKSGHSQDSEAYAEKDYREQRRGRKTRSRDQDQDNDRVKDWDGDCSRTGEKDRGKERGRERVERGRSVGRTKSYDGDEMYAETNRRRDFSRTRSTQQSSENNSISTNIVHTKNRSMSFTGSTMTNGATDVAGRKDSLGPFIHKNEVKRNTRSATMSVASSGTNMRSRGRTLIDPKQHNFDSNPQNFRELQQDCESLPPGARESLEHSDADSQTDSESDGEDEHMKRLMERRELLRQRPSAIVRSRSLSRSRGIVRSLSNQSLQKTKRRSSFRSETSNRDNDEHRVVDRREKFNKELSSRSFVEQGSSSRPISNDHSHKTSNGAMKKKASERNLAKRDTKIRQSTMYDESEADDIDSEEEVENQTNKFLSFLSFAAPGLAKKQENKSGNAQSLTVTTSLGITRLMEAIGYNKKVAIDTGSNDHASDESATKEKTTTRTGRSRERDESFDRDFSTQNKNHPVKDRVQTMKPKQAKDNDGTRKSDDEVSLASRKTNEHRWKHDESDEMNPKLPRRQKSTDHLEGEPQNTVKRKSRRRPSTGTVSSKNSQTSNVRTSRERETEPHFAKSTMKGDSQYKTRPKSNIHCS